ncbi:MAG TPA: hypothetical protein VFQ26_01050, partial [Nitrospiraceae bacterium]|nr:hypothetical protein [Nitrospiraceae bacterium]
RDAAEKALIKLGPSVLGLLPPITPRTAAEVKERLDRVRKELETASAQSVANPTTVTLEGEMSLPEAFIKFEEQTGNRVTGYDRRSGKVQLAFQATPYWQAIDQLLDQAELKINEFGGEDQALVVMARPEGELPRFGHAIYTGVFRLEPLRLEARRDLRNSSVNGMQLAIGVTWEPRLTPIAIRQPLNELEIKDDRGETLAVSGAQGALNAGIESGMSAVELNVPLGLPSREAKKIASVKGRLSVLAPGKMETFEFSDLEAARDVEQERAGVTVTFERLRKNVDLFEARINVRFEDAANALESHRGWVYRNEAYLLDAKGQRMENVGLQATRQETNEVGVAFLFDLPDGAKGCKFVYKTPALLLQLPVEFELKDIDLP